MESTFRKRLYHRKREGSSASLLTAHLQLGDRKLCCLLSSLPIITLLLSSCPLTEEDCEWVTMGNPEFLWRNSSLWARQGTVYLL